MIYFYVPRLAIHSFSYMTSLKLKIINNDMTSNSFIKNACYVRSKDDDLSLQSTNTFELLLETTFNTNTNYTFTKKLFQDSIG